MNYSVYVFETTINQFLSETVSHPQKKMSKWIPVSEKDRLGVGQFHFDIILF